jgi:hypothetical protein
LPPVPRVTVQTTAAAVARSKVCVATCVIKGAGEAQNGAI